MTTDELDSSTSIAVFHGTALDRGGGVAVVEALAETLDADLYFGVCTPEVVENSSVRDQAHVLANTVVSRQVQSIPFLRNLYTMAEFQHIPELTDYDVVIESDESASWYVPREHQDVIRYVHSPPATLTYNFHEAGATTLGKWSAFVSRIFREPFNKFPSAFVANSQTTADRLEQYLDIKSTVLPPPVDTSACYCAVEKDDYYLSLSRLTPGKDVARLVQEFQSAHPGKRLTVAGSGPEEQAIREAAGSNTTVCGWVNEERKHELLANAKALVIHSGVESFGITPIEAWASGTPVIGKAGGHTSQQLRDGETGLLYDEGELGAAIARFESEGVSASAVELQHEAQQYDKNQFGKRFKHILKGVAS